MTQQTSTEQPTTDLAVPATVNAIRYLLAMQSLNGGWWDFTVSIGSSGPWVTGIVGEILNQCPAPLRSPAIEDALAKAVSYLQRAQLPEGGWSYNEGLPADCDSTAYSIIFLHSIGAAIEDRSLACLRAFQRDDGAFLTYIGAPPGHSWGSIHYDVYGPAVRALGRVLGRNHESVGEGLRRIFLALDHYPVWPAFWWKPQVYAVFQNLLCVSELGKLDSIPDVKYEALLQTLSVETPLSSALSGMVALMLQRDGVARNLRHAVLKTQLPDGSWPPSKALRVTDTACFDPWSQSDEAIAGPLYRDTRRVFTTAVALKFLLQTR